ncbi:MAG: hypothetical protein SGI84_03325 [Gemmatimonadota bacterium]|nr:hypothetical protein [Gemmatimonadota bacterium]
MPPLLTPTVPGTGPGWDELVSRVTANLPADAIDGIWVFRVIRSGGRDWGTAVISRIDGDRRRIYTATFVQTVKGKRRGAFAANLEELGSGPLEAREELLALVPRRTDEDDPLVAVPIECWFPPAGADAGSDA